MALPQTPGRPDPASDPAAYPPPPDLMHYATWTDEEGYHARFYQPLPTSALDYGCVQEIWATTESELIQEAVRNRIAFSSWESGESLRAFR